MPSEWEVEFDTDMLPDTEPISIPLCRMPPAKLRELKEPLKDLLVKGFIRPSMSPRGAIVLFVRMKEDSLRMYQTSSVEYGNDKTNIPSL